MATLFLNYSTKTRYSLTDGTDNIFGKTILCCDERLLKGLHRHVELLTALRRHNGLDTEVLRIQIWWRRRPELLWPKVQQMVFAPLLADIGCMTGCSILVEWPGLVTEVGLGMVKQGWLQNPHISFGIDFDALRDEDQRGLPSSWAGPPHYDAGWFLASEVTRLGHRDAVDVLGEVLMYIVIFD